MDNVQENNVAKIPVISVLGVDKYVETHIVSSEEIQARGRDFINWGPRNDFPEYLYKLYKQVTTLHSVIGQCVDYVSGNKVVCSPLIDGKYMNSDRVTPRQFVRNAARDYFIFGGFVFNVIRAEDGHILEVYNMDMRRIRSNKENTVFYYSEDWAKRWGKTNDLVLPMFDANLDWDALEKPEDKKAHGSSIAYFKGEEGGTYPCCLYEAAIKDCEIERMIEEFHLNDLNNGFAASYFINILSGIPEKEVAKQVEKELNEKLAGYQNAGRLVVNFADDKEHMATAQRMEASNFEERYNTLAKRARAQIFAAFHANPNLVGIATENLGFNSEEYAEAFKLFNRTQIAPVQTMIAEAINSIYDAGLTITPFSLTAPGENVTAAGGANA